jgi:hypothetical protein
MLSSALARIWGSAAIAALHSTQVTASPSVVEHPVDPGPK